MKKFIVILLLLIVTIFYSFSCKEIIEDDHTFNSNEHPLSFNK